MDIIRGDSSGWIATDWVTAADTTGTGTTVEVSAAMYILMPDITMLDWVVEIERTQVVTAGTGYGRSYVRLLDCQGDITVVGGSAPVPFYSSYVSVSTVAYKRRTLIKPSVLQSASSEVTSRLSVYVHGVGTAAGPEPAATEWSMTEIRARLIYLPFAG